MELINDRFFKLNNTCVTLGKFDGLHKGHMTLINKTVEYCKKSGLKSVLFTFDMPRKCIYTNKQKNELIEESGIDYCIVYPFDSHTSKMEPEEFIENILVRSLGVKKIIVGSDFRFGHNRRGNVQMLLQYSAYFEYEVETVNKLSVDDRIVSSTLIKDYLMKGNIQEACRFLGRNYCIEGKVSAGQQLGRVLGFPTANIYPDNNVIMPKFGVYETKVYVSDEIIRKGITNIGCRPTVNGTHVSVETFIFDFEGDIYEQCIKIEFERFIRAEMKFSSINELKEQIKKDIDSVKK